MKNKTNNIDESMEDRLRKKFKAYKGIISDEQIEESIQWSLDLIKQRDKEIVKMLEDFWHSNYGMDTQGREYIYKKQFEDLIKKLK